MKKIITLIVIAAMFVSFGMLSSFAAAEPGWFCDFGEGEDKVSGIDDVTGPGTITIHDDYVSFEDTSSNDDGQIYPGTTPWNLVAGGLDPIDCDTLKFVVVKMRITKTVADKKLNLDIFNFNGSGHGSKKIALDDTIKDWQYIIADFSDVANWCNADVAGFRIDPVNCGGAAADIDWVAMFETAEQANEYINADKPASPDVPSVPTGDISMIFMAAAAVIVLTVVAKKKIAA